MPNVIKIKATRDENTSALLCLHKKKRVAAYARVSTDQDEQFTSFESQIQYYEDLIKGNNEYEFVKVYRDEGLSGTSVKKRKGFNEMINDAKNGKIDLILVKSISRFGRNLLDIIQHIQTLKNYGVEVHFDKEGLRTFDKNVDISLAIMSAIAQEESHSISCNVKAGKRYKFARGEYSMPYGSFMGYKRGDDGKPAIVPDEAEIVKDIYRYFTRDKLSLYQIAMKLNRQHRYTKKGAKWRKNSLIAILKNEKYKGDALLQKGYVKNYLDHITVKNEGELDQYYVEKGHEPIVSDEDWAMAQVELRNREKLRGDFSGNGDLFSGKLICADCGAFYGRKLWHSTDKYKKVIYQCNHKFSKGKEKCKTPNLTEDDIKKAFLKAYNELLQNKEEVIGFAEQIAADIYNESSFKAKKENLIDELNDQQNLINVLNESYRNKKVSEDIFLKKTTKYNERYSSIKTDLDALRKQENIAMGESVIAKRRIQDLKNSGEITEFDDIIFTAFVTKVVVNEDRTMTFHFITGQTILA